MTAASRPFENLLNAGRDDVGNRETVIAETQQQGTMNTDVLMHEGTSTINCMEVREMTVAKIMCSTQEMAVVEMSTLIAEVLDLEFQTANQYAENGLHMTVYYVVEEELINSICQTILDETLN